MAIAHNRLTKYGIVGLAGVAILGWVREPERHYDPAGAVGRATFQNQPVPAPQTTSLDFSGNAAPVEPARPTFVLPADEPTIRHRAKPKSIHEQAPRAVTPAAPRAAATAPESGSRHDFPSAPTDQARGTTVERSEQPQHMEPEIDHSTPRSRPVVRARQQRTITKSAMIIAGAAAAGAAIGGLSGGGRGAAIGAITAGAGGYVYDRITRDRGTLSNTTASSRDRDVDRDRDQDHFTSRFATPGFAR